MSTTAIESTPDTPDADRYATTDPMAHLGLVGDVVKIFEGRARSLTFDDLFQEGFLGLLKARKLFDPDRGVKFSTFATYCIKTEIRRAIWMQGPLVAVPYNVQARLNRERPGGPAAEGERFAKGRQARKATFLVSPRLLGQPDPEAGGVGDEDRPDPEELDWLRRNLGRLTPAMRRALVLRYGLDGGEPVSYPDIGRRCGISKQAAQDAARRGMRRLRKLKTKEATS